MSQRRRLFVLLLAVATPLVVLAAVFVMTSVAESEERAERDAIAIARAGSVATDTFLAGHLRTLTAISVGMRGAPALSESELRGRLAAASAANPEWDGMSVVAASGVVLAGSRETSAGTNLSERPYLRELFATGNAVVSDGTITTEGDASVLFAAPVEFTDGTRGAVIGSVTLATLSAALTDKLTTTERVGLIDRSGLTLIHPDRERVLALLNVGDRPEVVAAQAGESGVIEVDRGGTPTLVAFAPVSELGWTVTVAEPSASAFADANGLARRGSIVIGLTAVAVLVVGWYLGGRLGRSYAAMQEARTAEVEARQRAEAALKSRDEFISIASHELRNPVAAIRGFGQLMQRRLDRGTLQDRDLRDYVDNIATSGTYLSRLVEDLLNVSRLEGGRLDLRLREVDVGEVLQRVAREVPLQKHSLRLNPPSGRLMTLIDADRVNQILVNLLENAAKYSPEGSEVLLGAGVQDGAVHIAVTDRGIGLPEADIERLFVPFGRASNARDANIPGLGLGLYVSRRLALAHGGSLVASSDGEGQGATFTLVLPLPSSYRPSEQQAATQGTEKPDTLVDVAEEASV